MQLLPEFKRLDKAGQGRVGGGGGGGREQLLKKKRATKIPDIQASYLYSKLPYILWKGRGTLNPSIILFCFLKSGTKPAQNLDADWSWCNIILTIDHSAQYTPVTTGCTFLFPCLGRLEDF